MKQRGNCERKVTGHVYLSIIILVANNIKKMNKQINKQTIKQMTK